MRTLLLSSLLAMTCVTGAQAANVRWQGDLLITAKSGSCPDYDPTGTFMTARYRPAGIATNGTSSKFTVYFSGHPSAEAYSLAGGSFTSSFQTVDTMYTGDGFGPSTNAVQVRFSKVSPAITPSNATTATTLNVTVLGQIKGFDDMPSCTVTFTTGLVRRPD